MGSRLDMQRETYIGIGLISALAISHRFTVLLICYKSGNKWDHNYTLFAALALKPTVCNPTEKYRDCASVQLCLTGSISTRSTEPTIRCYTTVGHPSSLLLLKCKRAAQWRTFITTPSVPQTLVPDPNHPHLYLSQSSSIHVPIHKNLSAPIWKPYSQYTHTFNGPFSGTTRVSQCQKVNQSGFYWSKRQWVAVASAGPYAVVKVDRRIRWHYTTTVLRLRIGARLTRYRNCKFHNFTRTISRHADGISRYSILPSVSPLLPLTICKSAPRSRQITTPARDHSVLYRPDAVHGGTAGHRCILQKFLHKIDLQQSKLALTKRNGYSYELPL